MVYNIRCLVWWGVAHPGQPAGHGKTPVLRPGMGAHASLTPPVVYRTAVLVTSGRAEYVWL
jgi:hypothetical protein